MLLAVRVTLAIILVCVVAQLVEGNQRIVHVNESVSDEEDFFTRYIASYVCSYSQLVTCVAI